MTKLNDQLVLSDGTFKITHFCEEPSTGLMHVTMTTKRGFAEWSFSVPVSLWEEAARAKVLDKQLKDALTGADDANTKLTQLREMSGEQDVIETLQNRIAELEQELGDQKAKFPDGWLWFFLDQSQQERLQAFRKERLEDVPDESTSGGRFTIHFTPTGIGTAVCVSDCVGEKNELDLTDFSTW